MGDTMAEEREAKNPVQSAERIFQVMETLADHGEMGLMELSTALDLHKSTVHRLLMSLIYMGYAKQDEATQKYMLSYKVVNMAGKILERMDILQVAKPYMERLSDLSGEAVHLVQREGNISYIYTRSRRRSEQSAWCPMWEWYIRCTALVSAKRSWRRFRTRKSKRSGMRALLRKKRTRRSRFLADAEVLVKSAEWLRAGR